MGDSRIEPQAPVLIEPPQCGTALWSTHNMFGQKLQDKLRIIPFRGMFPLMTELLFIGQKYVLDTH